MEGADQFNVPNTLIYTRRVVRPDAAMKLTGKLGRTDVALLSAVDDPSTTLDGSRPFVGIMRLRRGIGEQSTAGVLFSERAGGGRANHLGGADVHWVFGRLYYAQFQGAVSATSMDGTTTAAPMWEAVVDRTGRSYGFHYSFKGLGDGFAADNGFVQRTDIVDVGFANRFTLYGAPGALAERFNVFAHGNALWRYDDFFAGKSLLEDQLSLNSELTLRGGWSLGVSPTLSSYAFDRADYANLFTGLLAAPGPFVPSDRIGAVTTRFSVSTPQFARFHASVGFTAGHDVDFLETSRVHREDWDASLDVRPTSQLRLGATYRASTFTRLADDARTQRTRIPRLKVEYQITRSIFLRMVAQYTAAERAALVDPRTGTRAAPPHGARRLRAVRAQRVQHPARRLAVLLQAHAGHRVLLRLRRHDDRTRAAPLRPPRAAQRRVLREDQLPVPRPGRGAIAGHRFNAAMPASL